MYAGNEVYYTLQGEGTHAGRPAAFLRFSGCNLWTGRERDRTVAICRFCDTNFVGTNGPGGGKFTSAEALADRVRQVWSQHTRTDQHRYVVCTGGEPQLQLDELAICALHERGFEVGVETNGTQGPPPGLDWISVSPKADALLRVTHGNEIKVVFPQPGAMPFQFEHLNFEQFYIQPIDGPNGAKNTAAAIEYCLRFPRWKLSLQIHKMIGLA